MIKFLSALQFLTIFRFKKEDRPEDLKKSAVFFPFVGLIIGAILCGAYFLSNQIFPLSVTAVMIVVLEIFITRALHIDGLADFFDGIFGGNTREQKLLIMQDSRIGVFGAVAATMLILLKIEIIKIYFYPYSYLILFLMPVLSRWSILYLMHHYPYAKETGLGKAFEITVKQYSAITILVLALFAIFIPLYAVILLASIFVITKIIANFVRQQIGGMTGDVYGFFIEFNELLTLLIFYLSLKFIQWPFLWQINWKNLF